MNKGDSEALEYSIAKYRLNKSFAEAERYKMINFGGENCGFCDLHGRQCVCDSKESKCPIYIKTGEFNCGATPYWGIVALKQKCIDGIDCKDKLIQEIDEMIKFLESLRD